MSGRDCHPAETFDEFAGTYDHALAQGLSATGEGREFFARGRIQLLKKHLDRMGASPINAMEFGCGTGSNLPILLETIGTQSVLGLDVSEKSIEVARSNLAIDAISLARTSEYRPEAKIDLAFCNGVFHHIDEPERLAAVRYVYECLRPNGLFALWENNPWNPGTRLVMKRIPFDRDAIMLSAPAGRRLLEQAGFRILSTDYLFIFPHTLRALRPLEVPLSKLPLGGQYQLLAIKDSAN